MGSRGPVPKRSDQRLGHRAKSEVDVIDRPDAGFASPPPKAHEDWHPVARRMFESLAESGQSRFYEASDWALAVFVAESMSRDLKPQFLGFKGIGEGAQQPYFGAIPLKGASLAAYLKAMSNLLVTEGDRRRVALELQQGPVTDEDDAASVTALAGWRERLADGAS